MEGVAGINTGFRLQEKKSNRSFFFGLLMCFLPNVSVAGVGERLRNANIAAHFRWKGCA
jgi:hypothetical protein